MLLTPGKENVIAESDEPTVKSQQQNIQDQDKNLVQYVVFSIRIVNN